MSASFSDLATSASNPIGRYFTIVSTVPSVLLVAFVFVLLETGVPGGPPDWRGAVTSLANIGLNEAVAVALASFMLAVLLHPLQFAFVQLLEGYWGTGRVSGLARAVRVHHHRAARVRLAQQYDRAESLREELAGTGDSGTWAYTRALSRRDEIDRATFLMYPGAPDRTMPTRLGNVLRRYETSAGFQYDLDATVIAPHLALVADKSHVEYLNDQRTVLDLAVRLTVSSLLATAVAVALLWPFGLHLLVALVPYVAAYAAYRGAIVAAHHYGIAVSTVIDLNRPALYQALRLAQPQDSAEERDANQSVMELLRGDREVTVSYVNPDHTVSGDPREFGRVGRAARLVLARIRARSQRNAES